MLCKVCFASPGRILQSYASTYLALQPPHPKVSCNMFDTAHQEPQLIVSPSDKGAGCGN